jgi:hypothetical protein
LFLILSHKMTAHVLRVQAAAEPSSPLGESPVSQEVISDDDDDDDDDDFKVKATPAKKQTTATAKPPSSSKVVSGGTGAAAAAAGGGGGGGVASGSAQKPKTAAASTWSPKPTKQTKLAFGRKKTPSKADEDDDGDSVVATTLSLFD